MITVTTRFHPVAFILRDSAPDGVTVSFGPIIERRDFGTQDLITISIGFVAGIPSSMVAAWLYDKLKGQKTTKIRIHRTEIDCDNGDLKRMVEETISVDYES
jgi:hypothetical protein